MIISHDAFVLIQRQILTNPETSLQSAERHSEKLYRSDRMLSNSIRETGPGGGSSTALLPDPERFSYI